MDFINIVMGLLLCAVMVVLIYQIKESFLDGHRDQ